MTFEEKIISLIKENSEKANEISLDTNIWQDIKIDSLDFMMILNAIEDEYDITINDTNMKSIQTISDIILQLKKMFPGIENEH